MPESKNYQSIADEIINDLMEELDYFDLAPVYEFETQIDLSIDDNEKTIIDDLVALKLMNEHQLYVIIKQSILPDYILCVSYDAYKLEEYE